MANKVKFQIRSNLKKEKREIFLNFSRVNVPKMRSVFWKYFGYPSNESGSIITKQTVICILCQKMLTNHGNTTNLRAHIQSTHKETFNEICRLHSIKIPLRRTQKKSKKIVENGKTITNTFKKELFTEYKTSAFNCDEENAAYLDETSSALDIIIDDEPKKPTVGENLEVRNLDFSLDVTELDSNHFINNLTTMIIKDLRNVSTLYERGMIEFLMCVNNGLEVPQESKIIENLKQLHQEKSASIDQLKNFSQDKSYSFGFDQWENIKGITYLTLYFNFISDDYNKTFHNEMYCTVEYHKNLEFDDIFKEFNLANCCGAVFNYVITSLENFLKLHEIPIIYTFSFVLNKCISTVVELKNVSDMIDDVKNNLSLFKIHDNFEKLIIPTVNSAFPETYYWVLKFFCEHITWSDEVDSLITIVKDILELLNPLIMTIETLKDEEIPYSSLLTPIATKLIKKHYSKSEADSEVNASIKEVIASTLEICILSNNHLTISALLDPRFHQFVDIYNISECIEILQTKYKSIKKLNTSQQVSKKPKANLKLLFDIIEFKTSDSNNFVSSSVIEGELLQYRKCVHASLDESPVQWWNKYGYQYKSLKLLADSYQCIPCYINMDYKKLLSQQINLYQKRYLLDDELQNQLLYLHHYSEDLYK